jgi:tRNA(Ile)-lysidine synthase
MWFAHSGVRSPDERRLNEILRMLDARPDATPTLTWPGARLRRNRGRLIIDAGKESGAAAGRKGAAIALQWDWRQPLVLPGGRLAIRREARGDVDLDRLPETVAVRMGSSSSGGRRLRSLLQELEVPNWQRADLPLLYDLAAADGGHAEQAGRLLAVRDLWVAGSLRSDGSSRHRGRITWT